MWSKCLFVAACCSTPSMLVACGGDEGGVGPPIVESRPLTLTLQSMAPLDPSTEGSYEAWVAGSDGQPRSAGRFQVSGSGSDRVALTSPIRNPAEVFVTVEPVGTDDGVPAPQKLIRGDFNGTSAEFTYISALTAGLPFVEEPGTHFLFTPSDNPAVGYPSNEDAGIWLFQAAAADSGTAAFWLDFMPLRPEWTYEGWVVLDYGTPDAVWFSYGKFAIDVDKQAKFEDDSGFGPFSGRIDYLTDPFEEIEMPGDDWIGNPHGVPLPGGLPESVLPLDLNGCLGMGCRPFWSGPSSFTHVITVEPATDMGEDPWLALPFFVAPYRNPIGEGPPDEARRVEYFPETLPRGDAILGD